MRRNKIQKVVRKIISNIRHSKKKISHTLKLRAQIQGFRVMHSCYKVNFLCSSMRSWNSNSSSISQEIPAFCF